MVCFLYRFGIYILHVKQQKLPRNKKEKLVRTSYIYCSFTHILQQNIKPVQYGCLHRQIPKANKNIVPALVHRHNQ